MSATEKTVPEKCHACDAELKSPIVCQGCRALYPLPETVDYFSLLALPRRYDLDEAALAERFVALSRNVHPDFFTGAGEKMSELATKLSAELNDAAHVLKDPVLRAGYLLVTCGGPSAAEDRTVPPDVLAAAMLLREEIEEAQAEKKEAELDRLRDAIGAARQKLLDEIAALARTLPDANSEDKTCLRRAINSIKYYDNMLELLWID